jgi:hypothetical protein
MAQAFSRPPLTVEDRDKYQARLFGVDKLAVGQVLFWVLLFSLVIKIPPVLCAHSFIYRRR